MQQNQFFSHDVHIRAMLQEKPAQSDQHLCCSLSGKNNTVIEASFFKI